MRQFPFIFPLAVCFCSVHVIAQPASPWTELIPEDKAFTVLLPGIPLKKTREIKTSNGNLHVVTWVLESGKGRPVFFVSYSVSVDGPHKLKPDQQLARARDGALASTKGKLQSEKKVTLQGNPGLELVIDLKDAHQLRSRIYLVKDRLYQLFVIGTAEQMASKEIGKFLDSFELKPP